jgi:hypothetical protein
MLVARLRLNCKQFSMGRTGHSIFSALELFFSSNEPAIIFLAFREMV